MNALELEGLTIVRGGYTAVSGLDLAARPGDCILVFGRYGSGKQSLLQAVAGVLEPTAGSVLIRESRPGPRLPVGYVPLEGLLSNLSLLDNAVLPAVYHGLLGRREAEKRALALFEEFSLSFRARRRPAAVSQGARRLAQTVRALLLDPTVFVLDDPLADIEAQAAKSILSALQGIKSRGEAVCLAATTGRLDPFLDWAHKFLWIREGQVAIFDGKQRLLESGLPELDIYVQP